VATPALVRVVEREARVYRHLWRGSVFSNFLAPVLFLAAMGVGLGDLVDERAGAVEGVDYLAFVTPGLLAAGAMQGAAAESLWPVMAGMKWVRFYHGVVASPVSAADVYGGHVLWVGLRTAVSASAFLLVAGALGGLGSASAVLALPAAVLTALAFSAPLTAYAATQQTDLKFVVIVRLGIMPMFLFSGTFFPVDQLPAGLRPLAFVSPLWHGVELCRAATTGTLRPGASAAHLAVLVAVIAASWAWGTRTFPRRLTE
jgi:lipooligosaccharide transport system permease protein